MGVGMGAILAEESKDSDDGEQVQGIRCSACWCRHFYVTHTNRVGRRIKRRRICRNCGKPLITWELAQSDLGKMEKPQ